MSTHQSSIAGIPNDAPARRVIKGFSPRKVKTGRDFAERRPDGRIGQQAAVQLPWFPRVAQYAVRSSDKPIGIPEFEVLRNLPVPLAQNLPSIEEIEAELSGDVLGEAEMAL